MAQMVKVCKETRFRVRSPMDKNKMFLFQIHRSIDLFYLDLEKTHVCCGNHPAVALEIPHEFDKKKLFF